MQVHFLQRIVVFGVDFDCHLFNRADFGVFARLCDLDARGARFPCFDEVIVGQPHQFAVIHHGDVIHAVLLDRHVRGGAVVLRGVEIDRLAVVENKLRIAQRFIGLDLDLRDRALDRAQVAARIFGHRRLSGPGGVIVGDANILHGRQIDGMQFEGRRT